MNLTCSSRIIKYLLFVFNLIFFITGTIILGIGVSVKAYYHKYDTFLDERYFNLPNLLIAIGAIIFFISFFGCCGAIKESWLLVTIFSVLLGVVFILELSAGIAGYALKAQTAEYLDKRLRESMKEYGKDDGIAYMWDTIQKEFECCGAHNYTDWNTVFENASLPNSCCPDKPGTIYAKYCNANAYKSTRVKRQVNNPTNSSAAETPSSVNKDNPTISNNLPNSAPVTQNSVTVTPAIQQTTETTTEWPESTTKPYQYGCETSFGNFIRSHAVDLGGVGIALAVIQLLGIVFSCHLARQLKHGYYST